MFWPTKSRLSGLPGVLAIVVTAFVAVSIPTIWLPEKADPKRTDAGARPGTPETTRTPSTTSRPILPRSRRDGDVMALPPAEKPRTRGIGLRGRCRAAVNVEFGRRVG